MAMSKLKQHGKFEGGGFLALATVLFLIAIGIVAGKMLFPGNVIDYYALGLKAKEEKSYGEAYYYFNQAIESGNAQAKVYVQLAEILYLKGRNAEATSILESGLETVSDKTEIRKMLSVLYESTGDFDKMIENILALIPNLEENEDKAKYNYYLGLAYFRMSRTTEAKQTFKSVLDNYSGTEWYFRSSLELALFSLQDATTRDPLVGIAKHDSSPVLSNALALEDKISKAQDAKSLKDEGQMWGWYGVALLEQDRCELSQKYFESAIENSDRWGVHAGIHGYYGECLYRVGDYEKAKAEAEIAVKSDPLLLSAWETMSNTCSKQEDHECAQTAFEKLTIVEPDNVGYLSSYYDYLVSQKKYEEALALCKRLVLATDEGTRETVSIAAIRLLFSIDSFDETTDYLDYLHAESAEAYTFKAWNLYSAGGSEKIAEAEGLLEKAIEIDPYFAEAWYYLAVIKKDNGEDQTACAYAARSIDYDLIGNTSKRARELLLQVRRII